MDDRYNGWRNRETWLINLWFGDDNPEVENIKEMFEEEYKKLPDFIKDFIYISSIDWEELEKAWEMDEVKGKED